jgi:LuxR family maltose regulon positive regulatory protein
LLESKLRPHGRPRLVARPSLTGRLAGAADVPVVAITAPAGFGKTELLVEWSTADPRPFAWVNIDEADNDPATLLRYVAEACDRIAPIDLAVFAALAEPRRMVWSEVVPRLGAAISDLPHPFVLVLDGGGDLESAECVTVIECLIDHLGRGSQLAISGRERSPLPLPRLRAERRLLELGIDELAMDRPTAAALMEAAGAGMADDDLDAVLCETEGWPAGLVLTALAIRGDGVRAERRSGGRFHGVDRLVIDYLRTEHLAQRSDVDVRFLTRAAVLDSMTPALCQAALDVPCADQLLRRSRVASPFVIGGDDADESCRFHRLYRQVLLAELAVREPTAEAAVCRAAASWHAAQGEVEQAVGYAIRCGDLDLLAELIGEVALEVYDRGDVAIVERWVEHFDDERLLMRHPAIAVIGAWIHALRGRSEQAERWGRVVEQATADGPMPDGSPLTAWALLLRAATCRRGTGQLREDAERALAELSPFSPWRSTALIVLGVSHLFAGRAAQADVLLAEAAESAEAIGSFESHLVALAERAILALDDHNLQRARSIIDDAISRAARHRIESFASTALLLAVAARVAVAQGRPSEARRHLSAAQGLRPLLTYSLPWLAVQTRLQLGAAYMGLADAADVRALLLEIDDILYRRPRMGSLLVEVERLRQQVRGLAPGAHDSWAATLTTAELRLLPLLASHWSFREIGEHLYLSRNTIKTQAISIYRKLGVSSRTQALARSAELGLLDEVMQVAPRKATATEVAPS